MIDSKVAPVGKSYSWRDLHVHIIIAIYASYMIYKVLDIFKLKAANTDVVAKTRQIFVCGLQVLCRVLIYHKGFRRSN